MSFRADWAGTVLRSGRMAKSDTASMFSPPESNRTVGTDRRVEVPSGVEADGLLVVGTDRQARVAGGRRVWVLGGRGRQRRRAASSRWACLRTTAVDPTTMPPPDSARAVAARTPAAADTAGASRAPASRR